MVDMTLKPEMRELLAKMKGKTFKSYECVLYDWWGYIVSPLRINLGSFAVDVSLAHEEVPGWRELDPYDAPDTLRCHEAELGSPFLSNSPSAAEYLVGERITGVAVVNDYIEMNGEPDGSVDVAIAIRTKSNVYTFSRDIWFGTEMHLRIDNEIDVPYVVEKCAEDWAEGPEDNQTLAKVVRTVIEL